MNKLFKISLFLFIISFCFSASLSLAATQLEVEFPDFSGRRLTSTSTLPQTIKYVFNVALLVVLLAILASSIQNFNSLAYFMLSLFLIFIDAERLLSLFLITWVVSDSGDPLSVEISI